MLLSKSTQFELVMSQLDPNFIKDLLPCCHRETYLFSTRYQSRYVIFWLKDFFYNNLVIFCWYDKLGLFQSHFTSSQVEGRLCILPLLPNTYYNFFSRNSVYFDIKYFYWLNKKLWKLYIKKLGFKNNKIRSYMHESELPKQD